VILSLGLPTRLSWLDFTVEAIFLPFNADCTPELEPARDGTGQFQVCSAWHSYNLPVVVLECRRFS
jgi:hypothetical protein